MPKASTAKNHTVFVCQQCGAQSPKFGGRCTDCGAWNSLVETVVAAVAGNETLRATLGSARVPILLGHVQPSVGGRLLTGIGEMDRVLGGGIVPGSIVLIGGEPGIGKSTLLSQVASAVGTPDRPTLYVSAEESPQQIKLRADRMGISGASILLSSETVVETIKETVQNLQPCLVVIDSIQTIATDTLSSAPGSVSQVRECTMQLMRLAKEMHVPIMMIGHVTKDGAVAGPRALEHIVDAVLYLEGERFHSYRLLRSVKNRFGATEVGIFEMRGEGLVEVADPSGIFLADRALRATGSAVTVTLEGTRPLLVEVQALASPTSYGTPSRTVTGVDHTRLLMLLAVLMKRVGLRLGQHDVYVNVVGGIELAEPAVDLGIAAAVASSFKDCTLQPNLTLIGEVGLGGELRAVSQTPVRVREAARLGFQHCIIPKASQVKKSEVGDIEIIAVATLAEAIAVSLDEARR